MFIIPLSTFKWIKDPLLGLLFPSIHIFKIAPISSGLAHVLKSASTIASLFTGVSIVSGKIVITELDLGISSYWDKFIAILWTATLDSP